MIRCTNVDAVPVEGQAGLAHEIGGLGLHGVRLPDGHHRGDGQQGAELPE